MTDPEQHRDRPPARGPVAVLANTSTGSGRSAALLPSVVAALAATGRPVRVLDASGRDAALAACRAAVDDGAAAIVTVGGDGTAHLAIQAVAATATALGVVPTGTGNDLAAELGLARRPAEAARAVAAALAGGSTRSIDLARAEDPSGRRLWYGAVLAAGFDAAVNARANRLAFPRGRRRYDAAILLELARLRARRYTLRLDGVEHRVDAVLVAVANTGRYGAGLRICPHADPTDGRLDVVVGGRMGRATLVRLAPAVRRGSHLGHPAVSVAQARVVELAADGATAADGVTTFADGVTTFADGERALRLPLTVRCVPGALRLLG